MGSLSLRCAAALWVALLVACSNGRGSLVDSAPAPEAAQPPPSPDLNPAPTPEPEPSPAPEPSPPPAPAPPAALTAALAGYWAGSLISDDDDDDRYGARALITAAGDMHFFVSADTDFASAPQFLVYGNVCCASQVDARLASRAYLGEREIAARFRATLRGDVWRGQVSIRGDEYEFTLQRSSRYAETLTLAELAGIYSRTVHARLDNAGTYTLTVDPSGQLTGSHTNGCIYNGSVVVPNPLRNLVLLEVTVSNCRRGRSNDGFPNGRYSGLGLLVRDTPVQNDFGRRTNVFLHSLVGPSWLGQQAVER